MAIFNENYIAEFFFNKKKSKINKQKYIHLDNNEISKIISIAKTEISKFPKLNKATSWIDITKPRYEGDEISLIDEYFNSPGNSELIVAEGDAWDGYSSLRTNYMEYTDDVETFCKNVKDQLIKKNILAKFYFTGNADWDGIEFAISSNKKK